MDTIELFARGIVNFAWAFMLALLIFGAMYGIGKLLQSIALRRRVNASDKHDWDGGSDVLTSDIEKCRNEQNKQAAVTGYVRLPTLPELKARAHR